VKRPGKKSGLRIDLHEQIRSCSEDSITQQAGDYDCALQRQEQPTNQIHL
jgi:hypothetical protein